MSLIPLQPLEASMTTANQKENVTVNLLKSLKTSKLNSKIREADSRISFY